VTFDAHLAVLEDAQDRDRVPRRREVRGELRLDAGVGRSAPRRSADDAKETRAGSEGYAKSTKRAPGAGDTERREAEI